MTDAGEERQSTAERNFRWTVWLAVAAIVALGMVSVSRGESEDKTLVAKLTLITLDRSEIACASADGQARYACEFRDDGSRRTIGERDMLRPYMTQDRRLYLIPGLFLQPELARRYQAEPPTPASSRDRLRRFTATCTLARSGRLDGFKLRWAQASAWSEPLTAEVVTVVSCQVNG